MVEENVKHMTGFTYNEVSRRYVDEPPEFYYPDEWRSRPEGSVKQGSGSDAIRYLTFTNNVESWSDEVNNFYQLHIEASTQLYNSMIKEGIAPEQARMVLPQSMYTEYYATGSLAAWARAYKQRSEKHAQLEIQGLAAQWDKIIAPLFPVSWKALCSTKD